MSSGSAGKSVSSSFGLASSFFYPGSQCRSANTKSTLNTTHAGTFVVCCQDLLFLLFRIASLRFEHATFAAIFAPILLATAGIVPVFHDVLASTCSTSVDNKFCDHATTILLITSFLPLPKNSVGFQLLSVGRHSDIIYLLIWMTYSNKKPYWFT